MNDLILCLGYVGFYLVLLIALYFVVSTIGEFFYGKCRGFRRWINSIICEEECDDDIAG